MTLRAVDDIAAEKRELMGIGMFALTTEYILISHISTKKV